ncbi:response regulator [Paenibacillus sp. P96]|uniref:Response regulator n=1 Tax=Paenibacillus zeirhizosphaerae TaxID=2987519 RepID=A0ABT9FR11_9BACL|nr:response regulator [Paenibacillus sp. P96]MDP4097161.1 response regulator [Paenibacillus sp. P96]
MINILLVDDETYVTESLAVTLPWEELGINGVYQAASSMQALAVMEKQDIDILVTDIRMPGMTGLELIETVGDRWPHIRSILLTGHSDFEYAKKAIQLQAVDYILKPVNDDELLASVTGAMESLKEEWETFDKMHKLMYSRKTDIGILRTQLMHDLLLGRKLSIKSVQDKLSAYEIAFHTDAHSVMLLIQLGRHFTDMDHHSVSLIEYAIGNIAEEVFAGSFNVWHCKAPHDCLVLLVQSKEDNWSAKEWSAEYVKLRRERLEMEVEVFRKHVSNYLKGNITVLITDGFIFPEELPAAYRSGLSSMYLSQHTEAGAVHFLEDQPNRPSAVKPLESLYKPPTLIHLLESMQWEAAGSKIEQVFADMENGSFSREHLYEVYLSVTNALMYISHKQGRLFYQLDQTGLDPLSAQGVMHSLPKLKEWTHAVMDKLRTELSANEQQSKRYVIKQVQELVSNDNGQELSVKTIADQVYLHPVYLSKIYKAETGEGLGDYIIRMRMEKALYLLKHTNKKIYEITTELGYQNPQYFSKMFKKHYGMTPNEFRDQ